MAEKKKLKKAAKPAEASGGGVSKTVLAQKKMALKTSGRAKAAGPVRQFRLKRGVHVDLRAGGSGSPVEKGGLVSSTDPLDELEPDRYVAVGRKEAAENDNDEVAEDVIGTEEGDDPTHADRDVNAHPRSSGEDEDVVEEEASEEDEDTEAEETPTDDEEAPAEEDEDEAPAPKKVKKMKSGKKKRRPE